MIVEVTYSRIDIDLLGIPVAPMVVEVALQKDGRDGADGASFQDVELVVTTEGQTVFNIFNPIAKSELFIGELIFFENKSYLIQEILGAWKLIWLEEFPLSTTDYLRFRKYINI